MSFRLVVKPLAEAEIAEAFAWYEAQTVVVGRKFLDELERVEGLICLNPRLYPAVEAEVHAVGLRRFPYTLYYVVDREEVQLLACFHQRRAPRSTRLS